MEWGGGGKGVAREGREGDGEQPRNGTQTSCKLCHISMHDFIHVVSE